MDRIKDKQIEQCLESDISSDDSVNSISDEIEVSVKKKGNKKMVSKKILKKRSSSTETESDTNVMSISKLKNKTNNRKIKLDKSDSFRSSVKQQKLSPNKKRDNENWTKTESHNYDYELAEEKRRILTNLFPDYKDAMRKRKGENNDCNIKSPKIKSTSSSTNKKHVSRSERFNWDVSNTDKILSPRNKERTPSHSNSKSGMIHLNKSKTPTKLSAKKNLFSPEKSHQPSLDLTMTPNKEKKITSDRGCATRNNFNVTPSKNKKHYSFRDSNETQNKTPRKENDDNKHSTNSKEDHNSKNELNFNDNLKSATKYKLKTTLKTPKKDISSDNSFELSYEVRNKMPCKNSDKNKYLNANEDEQSNENEFDTVSLTIQNAFTPSKAIKRTSKTTTHNDTADNKSLDQLKSRSPLKEIKSSPIRKDLCNKIKSLKECSPSKVIENNSNDCTPRTPKRSKRLLAGTSNSQYYDDIVVEELNGDSIATCKKVLNSPNLKQDFSYKTTPKKQVMDESSPFKQNCTSPSLRKKKNATKKTIVELNKCYSDNNIFTSKSPLKICKECPNKGVNSMEIISSESQDKDIECQLKITCEDDKIASTRPSKHIQLNKIASPLKTKEITVTTPISKRKEKRGFLTPSMAKRAHMTTDEDEDALDITRKQLHISTIPKSLPCRDAEFSQIKTFLQRKIEHSAGGCMYISGVPGTGKTATVHAVIRALQGAIKEGNIPDFDFVEINGLRLTEPRQAYVRIYQALTNQKLTPDQAQQLLNKRFSSTCKKSTIILVDELDYLCNRRQDVVYNILDWPSKRSSGLVVLTISNTMDLPERTLKGRVTSRMGLTRLTFQPYTHHQLKEIVQDRLCGSSAFHPDAVQLVARKVAAVSGDARRALDICRRTTELVKSCEEQITINHVEEALLQLCADARVQVIRALSGLGQLVLRSVRDVCQRTGVDETTAACVFKHLWQITVLEGGQVPTTGELLKTCVTLVGLGLLVAEKGRVDLTRKMSLNVSSDDIHYALDNL